MSTRKLTLKSCAVRGPQGRSAYEAAVEAGYEGTAADYYAIIGGIPDELTRINISQGRQDAILEYHGTQISALQNENTSKGAAIQTLQNGLAVAMEKAENPAFPEDGTNARVVPSLSTDTPIIRNVAAPQLEGDAANKGYVDQTITDQMATKCYVPAGGSETQILRVQGGKPAWTDETKWAFGIFGRMVASNTQNFAITGLTGTFADLKSFTGANGRALPYFRLALPDETNVYRWVPLVHIGPEVAYFHSPAIPGVSTEAITIRMDADGATGTKY